MKIDKPLLQKVAQLAHLELTEHDEVPLMKDLNKIITWTEKLQEVNTAGTKPLLNMSSGYCMLKEDITQAPLAHTEALANAPNKDTNYFRVPQVKE